MTITFQPHFNLLMLPRHSLKTPFPASFIPLYYPRTFGNMNQPLPSYPSLSSRVFFVANTVPDPASLRPLSPPGAFWKYQSLTLFISHILAQFRQYQSVPPFFLLPRPDTFRKYPFIHLSHLYLKIPAPASGHSSPAPLRLELQSIVTYLLSFLP